MFKDRILKWDKPLIPIILGFIPIIFLGLFYFYPLAKIFIRSFFEHGDFSLQGILSGKLFDQSGFSAVALFKLFQSKRLLGIIWFTLWQAFLSTILTLLVALPSAYVMRTFDFKGKRLIMTLATLPFVLPTIVVAAAFQVVAASVKEITGISNINPIIMIILAHIFYNFSVGLRIISSFWSSIGKDMEDAASLLGANRLQIFFKVTLPLLKPAILASSVLMFIFCFSSFGVILILGGPSFSTIEVEIYRQAAHLFNLPVASCLSILQISFTFCMMSIYTRLQKKTVMFIPNSEKFSLRIVSSLNDKILVFLCVLFILSLCGLPITALVFKSFYYNGSISLIFYRELFLNSSGSIFYVTPVNAILNSLIFAFSSLAMALVVGGCAATLIKHYSDKTLHLEIISKLNKNRCHTNYLKTEYFKLLSGKMLEPIFMLPISTSAVTLGYGMIITFDKYPLNLRTSIFLIPVIHTLVAFPFVIRAILPALKSIPSNLKDAASIMGASPFKVWLHIELPIIARALSIGAVFAFTVSLGEFGAALLAARPEFTTVPVNIYKYLGQPGVMNYGQAMAMSSILTLLTAVGFVIIENMRRFGHEGF